MKTLLALLLITIILTILYGLSFCFDFIRSHSGYSSIDSATATEAARLTHIQLTARAEAYDD